MRIWAVVVLMAVSVASGTSPADAATLRVGPSETLNTIASAALVARDGDVVEIIAGDYRGDVAVWTQKHLTLRGIGGRPRLYAAGHAAEGKAIWVIRGESVLVENIAFFGARVPSLNGAGIRHEAGRLTVRDCLFDDNEMGILSANRPELELFVENSEFSHGVLVTPRISHLLYAGRIGRLEVRGSYFHHSVVGHLLKSRARFNLVAYNRLTDETGGRASYELEFPEGGVAVVLGNLIEQSATTENPRMIAYGAEGFTHPDNSLILASNTLVDELPAGGEFLHVWSADKVKVRAVNNLLIRACIGPNCAAEAPWPGLRAGADGMAAEEIFAPERGNLMIDSLAKAVGLAAADFRIQPGASWSKLATVEPGDAYGIPLVPGGEYVHRASWRQVAPRSRPAVPGAFLSVAEAGRDAGQIIPAQGNTPAAH